jgi:hypothetical protein
MNAQVYSLSARQLFSANFPVTGYKTQPAHPFNTAHFQFEIDPRVKHYSFGGELLFSNYSYSFPGYYENAFEDLDQFYDRTYAIGLFTRLYTHRGNEDRFFVQLSAYYNHLEVYQPIVIPTVYGYYTDMIDEQYHLFSANVAFGLSIGDRRWRWEPYFQIGFTQTPNLHREPIVMIGTIGATGSNRKNLAVIFCPIAIKYQFPRKLDSKAMRLIKVPE